MAEQLIIYIKDLSSLNADWIFSSQNGKINTPLNSGTLTELIEKNKNSVLSVSKIICIIAAKNIHLSYQNIPAKNKQRALQAIPFALEEQLAEDIDLLHFATGQADKNIYPVAAIKHETVEALLNKLSEYNIKPHALYVDINCLQKSNNSWNVLHHADEISIDQHKNSIINTDLDLFSVSINQLLQQLDTADLPETIHIWSDGETEELVLPDEISESIQVIKHEYKTSPIGLFSKSLTDNGLINLLQGPYKVISRSSNSWKVWKAAAILSAIAITLELFSGVIVLNDLEIENKLISTEINRLYKKSFPQSKRIVNARVQMENKLKQLRKSKGKTSSSFIDLLAASSAIIQQTNNLTIQAINFSNNRLELQFTIDKLSNVESLKNQLNQLPNIKSEILSSSSESKSVNAKITVEAI